MVTKAVFGITFPSNLQMKTDLQQTLVIDDSKHYHLNSRTAMEAACGTYCEESSICDNEPGKVPELAGPPISSRFNHALTGKYSL